jgi:hypothetical protein
MDTPTTTLALACAHADFRRARRGHRTARARGRLQRTRPRDLTNTAALHWQPARRRTIPLTAIVGTVDATTDFDARFRPASERVASRWLSIARAHHDGRPLPPIDVIELTDGYYVLDGRHRVSVARALAHSEIDAWTSRGALGMSRGKAAGDRRSLDVARRSPHDG